MCKSETYKSRIMQNHKMSLITRKQTPSKCHHSSSPRCCWYLQQRPSQIAYSCLLLFLVIFNTIEVSSSSSFSDINNMPTSTAMGEQQQQEESDMFSTDVEFSHKEATAGTTNLKGKLVFAHVVSFWIYAT